MSALVILETLQPALSVAKELFEYLKQGGGKPLTTALLTFVVGMTTAPYLQGLLPDSPASRDGQKFKELFTEAGQTVGGTRQPFVGFLWGRRRAEFENQLVRVRSGSFTIENHEISKMAIEMLKGDRIASSLVATSSTKDWWDTDWGRSYENLNIALASRVHIRRIFIYEDENELNKLRPHMERQRNNGIEVWYIRRDPNLPDMANDYVILDDACAGTLALKTDRSMIAAEFSFGASQVSAVKLRIDAVSFAAKRF